MRDLLQPVLTEIARRREHHLAEAERYDAAEKTLAALLYDEIKSNGATAAPEVPAPADDAEPLKAGNGAGPALAEGPKETAAADEPEKPAEADAERLVCQRCGTDFSRPRGLPGQKPRHCPRCRDGSTWPEPASKVEPPVVGNGEKSCAHCGDAFTPSDERQRYCSRECKKAQREHAVAERELGS